MKRILTALGNSTLNDELKKYSKYDVVTEDLFYQEAVLDISREEKIDVIIISALLQGQYELVEFLKELKENNIQSRIIVIVDTISDEDKNILISKGIFDILYDSETEISDVIDAIDREEPINIKKQLEKMLKAGGGNLKKDKIQEKDSELLRQPIIQKQEIITMFGTPGSGKSTLICNLVKSFSKKTRAKILLIDLDTLNGNLNEILDVSKVPQNIEILIDEDKKCGINYVADLVLKNRFDANVLEELVMDCGGFDFLSGNTSLHYCQNVLNEKCYLKLLEAAKEKYDFIFIDTNSNIFLDSTKWALQECSRVLFVTEKTNICLRKTLQLFQVLFDIWKIWKNKVQIILNKNNNEIDEEVFENVCGLKVVGNLSENINGQEEKYERILETLEYIPKRTLLEKINNTKIKLSYFMKKYNAREKSSTEDCDTLNTIQSQKIMNYAQNQS